ncbi:DUF5753 domain-containing protein [Streptomyces sp. NBC_00726]|uniref:DUF5753 domain-containing protein n=1 Tax=Streptomyces sp. NBC_00726 TaxID=2903674 RepID=UPI00386687F9
MSTPTVRRRRLGAKLRALRGELTLKEVTEQSKGRFAYSKLSRIETARSAPKMQDIGALLDLYANLGREVSSELRAALMMLAKEDDQRGWWHSYRGVISPVYEDLISLEAEAHSVSVWHLGAIPGLLQTGDYARELIRVLALTEVPVDALVQVRLARQMVLTREEPLTLRAIVAEQALRSTSSVDGLMHEQLGRLLAMGKRPNVSIQVVPANAALHVGQLESFSVLHFGPHTDLDVVHAEGLTSALYIEEREQVAAYRDASQQLASVALPAEESAQLIASIRKDA